MKAPTGAFFITELNMITLPEDFVEIGIKGYYWSTKDQWVYSIKSGVLKFMVRSKFNHHKLGLFEGWAVSENGKKIYLKDEVLKTLNDHSNKEMAVIRKPEVMPYEQRKKEWLAKEREKAKEKYRQRQHRMQQNALDSPK